MKFLLSTALILTILPSLATAEIKTEPVRYSGGGAEMKGLLAYDSSSKGKRPGVLVVHEWWGHNAYAQKRAKMLAELGYVALAVDMYGDGKQAAHPDDAGKFSSAVMSDLPSAKARFEAALKILKSNPLVDPDQIAAIGYCFGGGVVLHMARMGLPLKGVVSFHGMLGTSAPAKAGDVKTKLLVCHGAEDPFVPAEQVAAFKKEMADAGADMTFISYPGASHSFTSVEADANAKKFNLPIGYQKAADENSWKDMQKFFDEIFANKT